MTARLNLATTDRDLVNRLHELKDEMDATRRRPEVTERDEKIYVSNGLINMMGGYSFILGNLTTQTDPRTPDLVYITMTLMESKYTIHERESPVLAREVVQREHMRKFWHVLKKHLDSALAKLRGQFQRNTDTTLTVPERIAFGLVLGTKLLQEIEDLLRNDRALTQDHVEKPYGILHGRLLIAALSRYQGSKKMSAGPLGMTRSMKQSSFARTRESYNSDHLTWLMDDTDVIDQQILRRGPIKLFRDSDRIWSEPQTQAYEQIKGIFKAPKLGGVVSGSNTIDGTGGTRIDVDDMDHLNRQITYIAGMGESMQNIVPRKMPEWPPGIAHVLIERETEPGPDPVMSKMLKILLGAGEFKVTDEFWNQLGETILDHPRDYTEGEPGWHSQDIDRSYIILEAALLQGLGDRFSDFDQRAYLQQKVHFSTDVDNPDASIRANTNYPDMFLPTYADFFRDETTGKQKQVAEPGTTEGTVRLRSVWKKFAPTYMDLGVDPPYNVRMGFASHAQAAYQLARTENDVVEPSFFYWYHRFKEHQWKNHGEKKLLDEWAQHRTELNIPTIYLSDSNASADVESVEQLFLDLTREHGEKPSGVVDVDRASDLARQLIRKEIRQVAFQRPDGTLIAIKEWKDGDKRTKTRVISKTAVATRRTLRNAWTPDAFEYDVGTLPGSVESAITTMPDDNMSMARAYPTYRVYLVEEDRGKMLLLDDFYGVNCVSSVEIRQSKADAALAIIRITNVSRNFETDVFFSQGEAKKLGLPPDDEQGEPFFRKFRFRTGTLIQVRQGYSAKPSDLPIAFTGKIVEVKQGEVIQLVCQGHRAELLNELEYHQSTKNFHQILADCFKKINPPHLGRKLRLGDYSSSFVKATLGKQAVGNVEWWQRLFRSSVNSYTRNCYISSSARKEYDFIEEIASGNLGNAFQDFGEGVSRTIVVRNILSIINWFTPDSLWDNWIIPLQPFYDAIQEMARHQPGTVAYVVPWETDATLFFGLPSQPYYAYQPTLAETRVHQEMGQIIREHDIRTGPGQRFIEFLGSKRYAHKAFWEKKSLRLKEIFKERAVGDAMHEIATSDPDLVHFDGSPWDISDWVPDFLTAYGTTLDDNLSPSTPIFTGILIKSSARTRRKFATYRFDWTSSWDYLHDNDPELLRWAFSWVFDINPLENPLPGKLEVDWKSMSRHAMMPLMWSNYYLSKHAEEFEEKYLGENSPWRDSSHSHIVARPDDPVWNLSSGTSDPEAVRQKIAMIERAGYMSQETIDNLKSDLADLINHDPDYTTPAKTTRTMETKTFTVEDAWELTRTKALRRYGPLEIPDWLNRRETPERPGARIGSLHHTHPQLYDFMATLWEKYSPKIGTEVSTHEEILFEPPRPPSKELRQKYDALSERVDHLVKRVRATSNDFHGTGVRSGVWGTDEYVTRRLGRWRLLCHYLAVWHKEQLASSDVKKDASTHKTNEFIKATRAFAMPPGHKIFRQYHLISSRSDIIDNQITATMQEMHNTVTIRRPVTSVYESPSPPSDSPTEQEAVMIDEDVSWESFPINEGIPLHPRIGREYRKLLIKVENNAFDITQAARCMLSNLAEAVRPMYRGHLTIVGRHMKPHDVIMLYDKHNDMIGPFEVDEVVHHFTAETGWVTTITPHTLSFANDLPSRVQFSQVQWYLNKAMDFFNDFWIAIEVGLYALSLVTFGLSGTAGAGMTAVRGALRGGIGLMARHAARGGVKKGVRNAVTKALFRFARRVGPTPIKRLKYMNVNPHLLFGTIGRALGSKVARSIGAGARRTGWLAWFGTVAAHPLLASSTWLRMSNHNSQVPVDIAVLMSRGRPYTAGLEFTMQDLLSFSEQFWGWWGEMWDLSEVVGTNIDEVIGELIYEE
jgi:hypothetical protein